jgi:lysophospholipase L1-like esterase
MRRHLFGILLGGKVFLWVGVVAGAPPAPQASAVRQTPPTTAPPASSAVADRWETDIKKFEDADHASPPPKDGVVFVGSSSIVRWNLQQAFPELGAAAINRGFGGSVIADAVHYADRIVIPYRPRMIVLYSGDNDLVTTDTPEQIAAHYKDFLDKVHGSLPQARIVVISIKPSVQRWAAIDKARAANALIRTSCESQPWVTYLDVEAAMLGADGKPRPELYVQDGLHMTSEGYKIWTAALRPLLSLPLQ